MAHAWALRVMCSPHVLSAGQLRLAVWQSGQIKGPCTPWQLKQPIKILHSGWNSRQCPPWAIITTYMSWTECAGGVLIEIVRSRSCDSARRSEAAALGGGEAIKPRIWAKLQTQALLRARRADWPRRRQGPPCAAVGLITQVSRAETPLAHCSIIWTSPEINFDAGCLWASGSGPRGGKRWLVSCVCGRNVFATCRAMKES